MSDPIPDDKILCYCKNVRYGEVRRAIEKVSARRVRDVMAACDAGTGCRTCHPEIEELLAVQARRRRGFFASLKRFFSRGDRR